MRTPKHRFRPPIEASLSHENSMDPKVVHTAQNNTEAEILKGWLEEQGIQAKVVNGEMNSGAFEIIETDPQVIVNAEDWDKATEIVAAFQQEMSQQPDMSELSDAEGQFDWPMCPVCDELRLARCEGCGKISNEFAAEDSQSKDHVFCPQCDETSRITFLDLCKYCEHDFTGATPNKVAMTDVDSTNVNRVFILVGSLAVLILVLTIWFLVFMK